MHVICTIADGNGFLGIEWHVWKIVGWAGNVIFFSRFFVQWIATEKTRQVVIPMSFWWLSLVGSLLLLIYGLWQRDSVFIFSYALTWIPYVRNIIIAGRSRAAQKRCHSCGACLGHQARFCDQCGLDLAGTIWLVDPTRYARACDCPGGPGGSQAKLPAGAT